MARKAMELRISRHQRRELEGIVRSEKSAAALVRRARIVLLAAEGMDNRQIGECVGVHHNIVANWKKRWKEDGLAGLGNRPRSGRPRERSQNLRKRIARKACQKPPKHLARWSVRTLARELKVPAWTAQRALEEFDLKLHQLRTFTLSPDPQFEEKLLEVGGLYMNPPENAVVLCIDEKTGIQALDRTQPMLPLRAKKPRAWTNEYVRHGTRTMLAGLDIRTGRVTAHVRNNRRSKTFLAFMNHLVSPKRYAGKRLYLVMDNLNTHRNKAMDNWLGNHPNVSVHYTPTHASWVNLIEVFFSILTRQGLQHSVHKSARQLEAFLKDYIREYNKHCGPFEWTKGPDQLKRIIKTTTAFQKSHCH